MNTCMRCGACCAAYRIPLAEAETDDLPGGCVPLELTDLKKARRCMKITGKTGMRCIALTGTIGQHVSCGIYEKRPTTCREFRMAWQDGLPNNNCDRARAMFGLMPFSQY